MEPSTQKLVLELDKGAELLRSCSESQWASWFEKCATLLRNGQYRGIEMFEGAFGGMGSINDLVLTPINGHTMHESEVNYYNVKLRTHLTVAQDLIRVIRKNMIVE